MRKVVSISMPPELEKSLAQASSEAGVAKSDFARMAIEKELRLKRWQGFQKKAALAAEALGLGPEDVECMIADFRSQGK